MTTMARFFVAGDVRAGRVAARLVMRGIDFAAKARNPGVWQFTADESQSIRIEVIIADVYAEVMEEEQG